MFKSLFVSKNKLFVRYNSFCRTSAIKCKLLIVGGGTGGCSVTWRFANKLKYSEPIVLLEPSQYHYNQPLFTLVAAGVKKYKDCYRPQSSVLPNRVRWMKDSAECFDPANNLVLTKCGHTVIYEYMVVALGVKNDYEKVIGLKTLLDDRKSTVTTIYSPDYCNKTRSVLSQLRGGHAVFAFIPQGAKCPGAAQKIMYLSEDLFRKKGIRKQINITYNTGGPAVFGVPKYAKSLSEIAKRRNVTVNCHMTLKKVTKNEAFFADKCGETLCLPYNFLHVNPPMSPPSCLVTTECLVNSEGFLNVNQYTLQHNNFSNIYGIGDCISAPNSKTAAAVAKQSRVVEENLSKTMKGESPTAKYDGYSSCPILTSYSKAILAEFLYDKKISETFPFDQSKESRILNFIIKHYLSRIYWSKLIKGKHDGPDRIKKIINPLSNKKENK